MQTEARLHGRVPAHLRLSRFLPNWWWWLGFFFGFFFFQLLCQVCLITWMRNNGKLQLSKHCKNLLFITQSARFFKHFSFKVDGEDWRRTSVVLVLGNYFFLWCFFFYEVTKYGPVFGHSVNLLATWWCVRCLEGERFRHAVHGASCAALCRNQLVAAIPALVCSWCLKG